MEITFKNVAKSPIADDEEGNVIYFIEKEKNSEDLTNQKTLSLAKLKTLEYRLFRKMREKLRGFYANSKEKKPDPKEFDKIVKKFKRES